MISFVFKAKTEGVDQILDFTSGDLLNFSRTAFGNHLAVGGGNTGNSIHLIFSRIQRAP
ncbi:MAG: hypothetical protein ABWY82_21880 [Tardiphaga sp.]